MHFCPTTPVILLGLKSDLRYKRNCIELLRTQGLTPVTTEQGQAVADRMAAVYMECSSKEMNGVEDIFDKAITIAVGDEYYAPDAKMYSKPGFTSRQGALGGSGGLSGSTAAKKKKPKSCTIL